MLAAYLDHFPAGTKMYAFILLSNLIFRKLGIRKFGISAIPHNWINL